MVSYLIADILYGELSSVGNLLKWNIEILKYIEEMLGQINRFVVVHCNHSNNINCGGIHHDFGYLRYVRCNTKSGA